MISRPSGDNPKKLIFPIESTKHLPIGPQPVFYLLRYWHMSTERQQQASRANGSKSHGPVTSAGLLNSSQNALKHGMLSETIVLKCESTDRFISVVAALFEEFQPQTPFEESLIEDMAVARWRRMRIRGMEKAAMDHEMSRQSDSAAAEDSATCAALAFRTLSDDSRSLELTNRYDSRCQREYLRAHRRFLEVRDRRTPPPLPAEGSGLNSIPGVAKTDPVVGPSIQECEISKGTPEVIENKLEPPAQTSPNPSPEAPTVSPSANPCHDKLPDDSTRSTNQ
jgi:hypothetical protein